MRTQGTFPFSMCGRCGCWLAFVALLILTAGSPARAQEQNSYWHTNGNQIVDARGLPVRMHGINWYGFETTNFVVNGLWAQDYHSILSAIRDNGYNVIRLPYSNQMVETNPLPSSISYSNASGPINTDLEGLTALQIMDKIIDYAGQLGGVVENHDVMERTVVSPMVIELFHDQAGNLVGTGIQEA